MLHPDVLAYTEPHGSNDGAVLILLKRVWKRKTNNVKKSAQKSTVYLS